MKSPLHILHLEDDQNDAELIQDALENDGISFAITRVQTRDDFVSALERGSIDLIFSDFALPAFDGLSATEIVRDRAATAINSPPKASGALRPPLAVTGLGH